MLGSGHMEVQCFDGEKRIAHIRGKMRKKVTIRTAKCRFNIFILGLDGCW
jgi:initiation factor 1A